MTSYNKQTMVGAFTAIGVTPTANRAVFRGGMNLWIYGTFVGTITLEKSFDGNTWFQCRDTNGSSSSFTAIAQRYLVEPEDDILYRFNCTAWTSGTINCRLSADIG